MPYHNQLCEMCSKPLKTFTSSKRLNRNYKDRPMHLKCWKKNQEDIRFNILIREMKSTLNVKEE